MNTTTLPVLIPVSLEDLYSQITAIVRKEVQSIQTQEKEERPRSLTEAAQYYGISKNTLKSRIRDGQVKSFTLGRRVLIKYSDLIEAGKTLKKFKR